MTVSASQVKELREKSGAGMMDCKKALVECDGNFEEAVDWLRKKGLAAAAKKAGRTAAEGLVAAITSGNQGVVVEVNSETDFVARNEQFQNLVSMIADNALQNSDIEQLKTSMLPTGRVVDDEVTEAIAVIGENLTLRRSANLQVNEGVVSSYVHNAAKPGMGTIAVLVALESQGDQSKLAEIARKLAMHVAAARPLYLNVEDVAEEVVEREKAIFRDQSLASGKPANIVEKMLEGRVNKFLEEIVLLKQTYVIDGKSKITEVLAEGSKEVGAPIELKGFVRFELGEGIEQQEATDFASEVASMAGK